MRRNKVSQVRYFACLLVNAGITSLESVATDVGVRQIKNPALHTCAEPGYGNRIMAILGRQIAVI